MLGSREKTLQPCEIAGSLIWRRSIAAKNKLSKGATITMKDLMWLRSPQGIRAGNEDCIIGRKLLRDIKPGELIETHFLDRTA